MSESVSLGRLGAGDSQAPLMPQVLPPGGVPGDVAIEQITNLYQVLQAQASRIDRIYGAAIPCDIQVRHNNAVRAYMTAAQSVFNQILSQNPNYKIVQYTYDASGTQMGTVTKPRPVMPAVYLVPGCPDNAPMMAGTLAAAPLLPLALKLAAKIIIVIVVAGAAVIAAKAIVVQIWPGTAIETVKAEVIHVDTQMNCIDRATGKPQNLSLEEAKKLCKPLGEEAPKAAAGFLSTFLIVLGVGTVGYFVYRAVRKARKGDEGPLDSIDGASAGFAGSRRRVRAKSRCLCF